MKLPVWVKPGLWGVFLGALAWWGVLAWGFGWVSASTAKQMASDQAQTEVVAALSPNCVMRFEQQPNAVDAWKALKKSAADYNQTDFIKKGGWVELPDQKFGPDIVGAVADSCSSKLLALKQLDGVKLSSLK